MLPKADFMNQATLDNLDKEYGEFWHNIEATLADLIVQASNKGSFSIEYDHLHLSLGQWNYAKRKLIELGYDILEVKGSNSKVKIWWFKGR
jgi:hypothetical protein